MSKNTTAASAAKTGGKAGKLGIKALKGMKWYEAVAAVMGTKAVAIACIAVGAALLLYTTPQVVELVQEYRAALAAAAEASQWELEPEQERPEEDTAVSEAAVSYISIPGFESATIEADSTTAALYLYNPAANECYFVISIYLEDGTLLYQSKLVSPGQELYEIELEQALSAGTYSAYINYATYTMDGNYTPLNGATVPYTMIAQ